jgi:hypothetical protein
MVVALDDNRDVSFQGVVPRGSINKSDAERLGLADGSFVLSGKDARAMLSTPGNPNSRPNTDVVMPYLVGDDITGRPLDRFIVDFGTMPLSVASAYAAPFEYIESVRNHRAAMSQNEALATWWMHWRARPEMRVALAKLPRFIVTPRVSKHRLFVWSCPPTLLDNAVVGFARADNTCFGILHSRIHEVWALRLGTSLEDRPRYTSTTSFQTFPFPPELTPNIPAEQYAENVRAIPIAIAAERLNEMRENWLNPSELIDRVPEVVSGYPDRVVPKSADAELVLKRRTLTNLYNLKPQWLLLAHRTLDEAVAAAYEWEWPLPDEEILKRLFDLNQQRAMSLDIRPIAKPRLTQAKKKLQPN